MKQNFPAWAILLDDEIGLAGRYYFSHDVLPQFDGCRCALFATRKIAREFFVKHIGASREIYKKPRVMRVRVRISDEN